MFDRRAFLDREIARVIDVNGDVAPPWARYPEIPWGSIGWRMGHGEGWLDVWSAWLARQPIERAWRLAYLRRHAPAPRTWASAAVRTFTGEGDDDEEEREGDVAAIAALEAAGAIGDDVGLLAWEALYGASPAAPWAGGGSLAESVRYGARELDFWARWCASRRASGALERWLAAAPPAAEAWARVREAAARGTAPAVVREDAYTRLGVLLAAHGQAPAPWVLGEDPSALREAYDDDASYADAWSVWVMERFDDRATWDRYLATQAPCPEGWSAALERVVGWP